MDRNIRLLATLALVVSALTLILGLIIWHTVEAATIQQVCTQTGLCWSSAGRGLVTEYAVNVVGASGTGYTDPIPADQSPFNLHPEFYAGRYIQFGITRPFSETRISTIPANSLDKFDRDHFDLRYVLSQDCWQLCGNGYKSPVSKPLAETAKRLTSGCAMARCTIP